MKHLNDAMNFTKGLRAYHVFVEVTQSEDTV